MIDIIDAVRKQGGAALLLGLDAEKALDRLSWPFLFAYAGMGRSGRSLYDGFQSPIFKPHCGGKATACYLY